MLPVVSFWWTVSVVRFYCNLYFLLTKCFLRNRIEFYAERQKSGMPLRPIVSSTGSVIYETSRELSRILKPLVGRSPHQVQHIGGNSLEMCNRQFRVSVLSSFIIYFNVAGIDSFICKGSGCSD